jgi:hypothetical protein
MGQRSLTRYPFDSSYSAASVAAPRPRPAGAERQHLPQKPPRIAPPLLHHRLRRAGRDDLAAGIAAFRAEVDDPTCGLDHFRRHRHQLEHPAVLGSFGGVPAP